MGRFTSFEEIQAWQEARMLARQVYQLTTTAEFSRDVGLKDQIRRAAVSVTSNIAEGFERGTDNELARYLEIAKGAAGEVGSLAYVALNCGYIDEDAFRQLVNRGTRIGKLIGGLQRYLRRTS